MGLFDGLRGELIDIVEWLDPTRDTMVHRFERHDNEIKNDAKLTVREGQAAVFVNEGQIADVFKPGMYTLSTQNIPVLATLKGWKYGFDSPFKAEVYFVATRRFTDLKWGTKNPITLRDADFGMVRLRAFGTYEIRVTDPGAFIKEIVGTSGTMSTEEISNQLRDLIVARFGDILGESKIPLLDLAASYDELGKYISQKIHDDFGQYGVEVTRMLVENISLPAEVEAFIDKRSSMGAVGDLNRFTQFQVANSIESAASNPGGLAGAGMGLGAGMAMANQMTGALGASSAPPALPGGWFVGAGGKQTGPFEPSAIGEQIRAGKLDATTLVWTQGMDSWKAAGGVDALRSLFAAVPPPMPPQ